MSDLLTHDELEARLREIGAKRYHIHHPFHRMLHTGKCSKGQVQAWALNRYYYQAMIPLKDGSLIGRCDDPALRREWRKRLEDHDGDDTRPGGIERWLKLTDGLGLNREEVTSTRLLLPATRFAVDALRTLRARAQHAGGRRLLPDRDVLAADHLRAHGGNVGQLRLCDPRHSCLLR